jgi:hypothetical protein
LKWVYLKNGSGSRGADAGWVDEVLFLPGLPLGRAGWSNDLFTVVVPSVSGRRYGLEYKDRLDDAEWVVLPGVTAGGPTTVLTNLASGAPQRFYRAHEIK